MSAVTTATRAGGGRARRIAILVGIFAPAAVVGAYLDWIWWPVYRGLSLTLAAIAILLAGGLLALIGRMIGRRVVRRVALTLLVVGVGLVASQNRRRNGCVGPGRGRRSGDRPPRGRLAMHRRPEEAGAGHADRRPPTTGSSQGDVGARPTDRE